MWRMLQHTSPEDFVIATGETHSVREFAERAFGHVGIELEWAGDGVEEVGRDRRTGAALIRVDPRYFRPTEVEQLLGDSTRARTELGWKPTVDFGQLVRMMVDAEVVAVRGPKG
jgi:GDPmannose 4,6-dehydratase